MSGAGGGDLHRTLRHLEVERGGVCFRSRRPHDGTPSALRLHRTARVLYSISSFRGTNHSFPQPPSSSFGFPSPPQVSVPLHFDPLSLPIATIHV
eukprot:7123561-Prymnesium_polylepis.1